MKKFLALVLTFCMILSLCACGKQDDTPADSDETVVPTSINIGCDTDILVDLFPYMMTYDNASSIFVNLFYDSLIRTDFNTGEVDCRLAESYAYSEDGLSLTFNLRQGVKFHTGEELKASDVAFSFPLFQEITTQMGIDSIDSVEATDEYTVVFHLKYTYAPLISALNHFYIISEKYFNEVGGKDAYGEAPVGTGPYKFVSWEKGLRVTGEAFDEYFRGKASIETVTITPVVDAATRAVALEAGDIDVGMIAASSVEVFEGVEDVRMHNGYGTKFCMVACNLADPVVGDPLVREAIAYAVDRDFICAALGGYGVMASSILFNSRSYGYSTDVPQYTRDIEKAKELLAQAGYPDGVDLGDLICNSGASLVAEAVQSQLAEVGITVKTQVLETATLYENAGSGNYRLAILRVGAESDAASYDKYLMTGGAMNYPKWNNADFDDLMKQAEVETDAAKRLDLYKQASSLVQEELPYVALFEFFDIQGANSKLNVDFGTNGNYEVYNFSWN